MSIQFLLNKIKKNKQNLKKIKLTLINFPK